MFFKSEPKPADDLSPEHIEMIKGISDALAPNDQYLGFEDSSPRLNASLTFQAAFKPEGKIGAIVGEMMNRGPAIKSLWQELKGLKAEHDQAKSDLSDTERDLREEIRALKSELADLKELMGVLPESNTAIF